MINSSRHSFPCLTSGVHSNTYDWTDEKDMKRVRAVLRELGIDRKIAYKADDDTFKGRYVVKGDTKISKYYE